MWIDKNPVVFSKKEMMYEVGLEAFLRKQAFQLRISTINEYTTGRSPSE
jgi:hypothetical protein